MSVFSWKQHLLTVTTKRSHQMLIERNHCWGYGLQSVPIQLSSSRIYPIHKTHTSIPICTTESAWEPLESLSFLSCSSQDSSAAHTLPSINAALHLPHGHQPIPQKEHKYQTGSPVQAQATLLNAFSMVINNIFLYGLYTVLSYLSLSLQIYQGQRELMSTSTIWSILLSVVIVSFLIIVILALPWSNGTSQHCDTCLI